MPLPVGKSSGITLIEITIALAIIAIISSIGYPLYGDYVVKSRRADAKAALMRIMQAQQRYYTSNSQYTTSLTHLGYTAVSADAGAGVLSEGGHYTITAAVCADSTPLTSCVKLTASPKVTDVECGNMMLDSTGAKSKSSASTTAKCW